MRRLFAIGLTALTLVAFFPDDASARRFGFSAGGFRSAGFGGFRGAAIGPRFGVRPAFGWRGAAFGPRYAAWGGRPWVGRWGWRNRWRYPLIATGVGLGYGLYSYNAYPYYDRCVVWNGWRWVNVCYGPYTYY